MEGVDVIRRAALDRFEVAVVVDVVGVWVGAGWLMTGFSRLFTFGSLESMPGGGKVEIAPPTDAESYLPVVRATRTNLELCAPR